MENYASAALCDSYLSRARLKGQRRQINVKSCRRGALRDAIFKCEQRLHEFKRRGREVSGKLEEWTTICIIFNRCIWSAGWSCPAAQLVIETSYFGGNKRLFCCTSLYEGGANMRFTKSRQIYVVLFMREEDWKEKREGKKRLTRGLCFLDDEERRFWLRSSTRSTVNERGEFRQVYKLSPFHSSNNAKT